MRRTYVRDMAINPAIHARSQARRLIAPLGRRWAHVQGVASLAERIAVALELDESAFVASAWLHDVGHAPILRRTGFHAADGARHLRSGGVAELVVLLVAHHSCARFEARLRGLEPGFSVEFARPDAKYEDALCYCDMTVGPSGDRVEARERLDEIRARYGPGHIMTCYVEAAQSEILAAVARVEERIAASGSLVSRQ
jgi:hypothetical protein